MADKNDERAALVGDLTEAELEGLKELDAQLNADADDDVFDPDKVYKGDKATDDEKAAEQKALDQVKADDDAAAKVAELAKADADAAAAAKPETDKPAVEPEPEPEPAPVSTAAPLVVFEAPENAEQQLADIASKKEALYTQLDDGDITGKEMGAALEKLNKEEREIERLVARAEDSRVQEEQRQTNERLGEINVFLKDVGIPHDNTDMRFRTLDAAVKMVASKPEFATATPTAIMKASYAECVKAGLLPEITKQTEKKDPPPKKLDVVPTLAKIPAAESNDTDANQFAWLNRISDPDKREAAYAKLTPAQQEAYLSYGS